jgi:glutamyl-tRNA reductase
LNLLSQVGLSTAKRIRTDTEIGRNPVSVAYAAVLMAEQLFSDFQTKRALLIGAGEIIQRTAEHLHQHGVASLAVANRTLANAANLAATGSTVRLWNSTQSSPTCTEFDIVIASTGSMLPVLHRATVEAAIRLRRRRPIFIVDLAVPRDVEPDVAELADVYLYTIDDLTGHHRGANVQQRRAGRPVSGTPGGGRHDALPARAPRAPGPGTAAAVPRPRRAPAATRNSRARCASSSSGASPNGCSRASPVRSPTS